MALNPLNVALKEHESMLAMRVANLSRLQNNLQAVGTRAKEIEREMLALKKQHDVLASMKAQMGTAPCADAAQPDAANDATAEPNARAA
jgi:coenzyme F420-reducing hydrogenase alpha subunit